MQKLDKKNCNLWVVIALSLYALFIIIYTISFYVSEGKNVLLSSNELGDFLAGTFAPLAFLFLYLGYIQQGRAIKQANQNIVLQLEQQGRMLDLQEQELRQREHATQPIFELVVDSVPAHQMVFENKDFKTKPNTEGREFKFKLHNTGEKVSSVNISLIGDINSFLMVENSVATDQKLESNYILSKAELDAYGDKVIKFTFAVSYRTSLGFSYLREYKILYKHNSCRSLSYDFDADYVKLPN